jgi:hypothetical protein
VIGDVRRFLHCRPRLVFRRFPRLQRGATDDLVAFHDHHLGGLRSQIYSNDSHNLFSFLWPVG